MKKNKKQKKAKATSKSLKSEFDPNGSYTGVSKKSDQKPVQDADDL